jgi:hypothetical protein
LIPLLSPHNQPRGPSFGFAAENEFLHDPLVSGALRSVVSTSSLSVPELNLFGFGPVAADGVGIAYMVDPGEARFCITDSIPGGGVEAPVVASALEGSLERLALGLARSGRADGAKK